MKFRTPFAITIWLSASSSLCYPMEYNAAYEQAKEWIKDYRQSSLFVSNNNVFLKQGIELLVEQAKGLHKPSLTLLSDLTLTDRIPEAQLAYVDVYYFLSQKVSKALGGHYCLCDMAFDVLHTLIKSGNENAQDLMLKIFGESPEVVKHFNQKLEAMNLQIHPLISTEDFLKIATPFLDALYARQEIAEQLDKATQEDIGMRYNFAMDAQKEIERKKIYLKQAIHYFFLSAKQGNERSQNRLVNTIKKFKAEKFFYETLLPFLEADDAQAHNLFNEVCLQELSDYHSRSIYDFLSNQALKLLQDKSNPRLLRVLDRVISNYETFRAQKNGGNQISMHFSSPRAEEIGSSKSTLPEEQASAESEFSAAQKLWNEKAYHDALGRFLEAEKLGSLEAKQKLDEIRDTSSYKNPQNAQEDDIGSLLRKFEPTAAELYKQAMSDWCKKPNLALENLEQAAMKGHKQATKKLEEIRKSRQYKSFGAKKDNQGNIQFNRKEYDPKDIGHCLKIKDIEKQKFDCFAGERVTKGVYSPESPNQTTTSQPSESQSRKKRSKGNQSIKTASPATTSQTTSDSSKSKKSKKKGSNRSSSPKGTEGDLSRTTDHNPVVTNIHSKLSIEKKEPRIWISSPVDDAWTNPNAEFGTYTGHSWDPEMEMYAWEPKVKPTTTLSGTPVKDQLTSQSQEERPVTLSVTSGKVTASEQKEENSHSSLKSKKTLPRKSLERRNSDSKLSNHKGSADNKEKLQLKYKIQRTKSLMNLETASSDFEEKEKKNSTEKKEILTKIKLKNFLKRKKSEKKLERSPSQSNLTQSTPEEDSNYSESEVSNSDTSQEQLFKQEGRRDKNLNHLKKLLQQRDLTKPSDIKLSRPVVTRTLRELGPKGKNIITWNFEKEGNKNMSKITATHCQDSKIALTIHLHSRSGKWYQDNNIKNHFLDFVRQCDQEVDTLITEIER